MAKNSKKAVSTNSLTFSEAVICCKNNPGLILVQHITGVEMFWSDIENTLYNRLNNSAFITTSDDFNYFWHQKIVELTFEEGIDKLHDEGGYLSSTVDEETVVILNNDDELATPDNNWVNLTSDHILSPWIWSETISAKK